MYRSSRILLGVEKSFHFLEINTNCMPTTWALATCTRNTKDTIMLWAWILTQCLSVAIQHAYNNAGMVVVNVNWGLKFEFCIPNDLRICATLDSNLSPPFLSLWITFQLRTQIWVQTSFRCYRNWKINSNLSSLFCLNVTTRVICSNLSPCSRK